MRNLLKFGNRRRVARFIKNGTASDKNIAASLSALGDCGSTYAAIYGNHQVITSNRSCVPDLRNHIRDEFLTAKTGIYAHHKQ